MQNSMNNPDMENNPELDRRSLGTALRERHTEHATDVRKESLFQMVDTDRARRAALSLMGTGRIRSNASLRRSRVARARRQRHHRPGRVWPAG